MANTLTGLIPTIYAGLDVVSREQIGFIPNVTRDATAESGAVGQTVRSPVAAVNELEDINPGNDPADSGDGNHEMVDVTITKSKAYPIRWTGEEQLSVQKDGVINTLLADQFEQGFRTIANAVEADIGAAYVGASRAYGTPGTTPFGTKEDMTDFSNANRILDDNGAPQTNRKMIVGSGARANLEGRQSQLFKVNEAGTDNLLRQRQERMLMNFIMGYSAGIKTHTPGSSVATSPDYAVDLPAGYDAGDTTIHIDAGTGEHVSGDIITFAGDDNKYIIKTGAAGSGDKDIILAKTGLMLPLADGVVATTSAAYVANMFFAQNAIVLAARQPAMPEEGDAADDVIQVQDPISGLVFQIAMYRQYRRIKYEIGLAWGVDVIKPQHLGILLG